MIVGLQEWKYSEAAVEIDVTTGAKSAQQSLDDHAAKCCFEPNTVSAFFPLRALLAPKFLHLPDFVRHAIGRNRPFKHIAANNSCLQNNLLT